MFFTIFTCLTELLAAHPILNEQSLYSQCMCPVGNMECTINYLPSIVLSHICSDIERSPDVLLSYLEIC